MLPGDVVIRHLIRDAQRIERLVRPVGEGTIPSRCRNGERWRGDVLRPEGHVHQVDTPIRHQPAAVVPEHPPRAVEARRVEAPLRRGAQPHVEVHARRHG